MKVFWLRIGRIVVVALAALMLYYGLETSLGYGWVLVPVALLFGAVWGGEHVFRIWKRKKDDDTFDRWEAAVRDPEARPQAIADVRERLSTARRLGKRMRLEVAHLSVVLAELLDAAGKPGEAADVLGKVQLDELEPAQAALVRYSKAVAQISAGRVDDADVTLRVRSESCGDAELDARLDLMDAMVCIERGDPESALEDAADVAKREGLDESVATEVQVVRAAALEAKGDHVGALEALAKVDVETLQGLATLGLPKVRPVAKAALEAREPKSASSEASA